MRHFGVEKTIYVKRKFFLALYETMIFRGIVINILYAYKLNLE